MYNNCQVNIQALVFINNLFHKSKNRNYVLLKLCNTLLLFSSN